ncbi:MAG: gliding motility-associated C-terminal domain-containing protein [Chitinophagales bacterium]|nr:gliding motility-associated C-terminal domain-containing protein [Chitinophagales bacterium]
MLQTSNTCDSMVNLNLTVNPTKITNLTRVICQGQSITVGTQSFTSTGNYTVVLQTSNTCDSTVNLNLTVNPTKITNLTRVLCQGQSITVGTQSFTSTGNYTVVLQTSNTCDSTVNLYLTVNPIITPSVTIQSNKNNICQGDAILFTAIPAPSGLLLSYQWQVNGFNTGSNSPQFSSALLNNGDIVGVKLTTTTNCANPTSVNSNIITAIVNSVNYIKPSVEYCKNDSSVVDLQIVSNPDPHYTIIWKNGNAITTNVDSSKYIINNTISGSIPIEINFGNNCKVRDVLSYTVNPLPSVNAVVDKSRVRYEEEVQLDALSNQVLTYNWTPSVELNDSLIKNPVSVIRQSTLFTVNVKDAKNCVITDSVFVELIDECYDNFIYMPMAFSPNRDGINDCFGIISPPKLSAYKLTIFDRWGEKVFESTDEKNCWDGTYKGSQVQTDSYIYLVSFKCYNGKLLSKKGAVTVVK